MRKIRLINHKGQVIIIVVLVIVLLLMFVGLAIDSGIGYGVKAKLYSAVDAAAIAAGRALGEGVDDVARKANAKAAATKFFKANFPAYYLRATPTLQDPVIDHKTDGSWDITIKATATVPTFFLRIAGINTFTASATSVAHRRDLDMAFVVDNTTSLKLGPAGDVTGQVKTASKNFIKKFSAADDRVALIKYAFGAEVPVLFKADFSRGFSKESGSHECSNNAQVTGTVCGEINKFDFGTSSDPYYTNSAEGFWNANYQLNSIPANIRSSLRVIVFFTDGAPNTFATNFTFNNGTQYAGSIRSDDASSGSVAGLWRYYKVSQEAPSPYYRGTNINNTPTPYITTLPTYYNPHGETTPVFLVVTSPPPTPLPPSHVSTRVVTSAMSPESTAYRNVNRASRNLLEDMAAAARNEGIHVFTLGLGSNLTETSGPDNERGDHLLVRMANQRILVEDNNWVNDTYNPNQPAGLYCFAEDSAKLDKCFNAVANQILRLAK